MYVAVMFKLSVDVGVGVGGGVIVSLSVIECSVVCEGVGGGVIVNDFEGVGGVIVAVAVA